MLSLNTFVGIYMNGENKIGAGNSQQPQIISCAEWRVDPLVDLVIQHESKVILPTSRFHSIHWAEYSLEEEFLRQFQNAVF